MQKLIELNEIESRLRELLLPVFGLESVEEVKPDNSLINDIGADSLDFVEILHIIECNFGVIVKADEIMVRGININTDSLFNDGKLTPEGASLLNSSFSQRGIGLQEGMTKMDLFSLLTIRDLSLIIQSKMEGVCDARK